MILPKMSFIEIVNELNKDAKQLDAYIDNVINDNIGNTLPPIYLSSYNKSINCFVVPSLLLN